MQEVKANPVPGQLTPWGKIQEQIGALDDALATIQGHNEESKTVRTHLIGQIDALKWAMKLWDVG